MILYTDRWVASLSPLNWSFNMGWSFFLLILIVGACMSLHIVDAASSSSCNYTAQRCGDLSIPYPFGMSNDCGLPDYKIECKLNASYGAGEMPFLQVRTSSTPELRVLNFSSTSNTITVDSTQLKAMPTPDGCNGKRDGVAELDLSSQGPFVLSDGNMFAVIGCDSSGSCVAPSTSTSGRDHFSIECKNGCYNQLDFQFCNSYACCSSAIPPGSRYLSFTGNGIAYADFPGVCGFSTVLTPSAYHRDANQSGIFGAGQYGMSISWALISDNCSMCADHATCVPDSIVPGYTCNCSKGFRGDGYTHGIGCEDIDECKERSDNCEESPIGICTNTVGSFKCSCAEGYTGSGLNGTCAVVHSNTDKSVVLATVLGGLAGAFFIAVLIIIVCVSRQAYRRKQEREENFHRNGGAELRSILYSEDELKRITGNFSREHELGKGGYGTVYWGKLQNNNCKVAIKKAKNMEDEDREEEQMKSFVSEILLLGKTTHENIVRLLGCCVETRVPLLVYEFIENGTLWEHLHPSGSAKISMLGGSWARRLEIAVGTAKALSYLHKMNPPILHRDIKSTNILIDKFYKAKVADFGASRFLTSGATHLTFALVVGTHGYLDPEYHRSSQFTDKSDVYSFGVVLLELITAMPPDLGTKLGLLAHHFQTHFRMNTHTHLIDSNLGSHPDVLASIQDVAALAVNCVSVEGNQRPSMEEVLHKLKSIHSKRPAASQYLHEMEISYPTESAMHSPQQIVSTSEEHSLLGSTRSRQYSDLIASTTSMPSTQ